jgi:hypothetical protein
MPADSRPGFPSFNSLLFVLYFFQIMCYTHCTVFLLCLQIAREQLMKIKDGFMLRQIAGSWVVVPLEQRVVEFDGLMTLNESGAILWKLLENGAEIDDLVKAITNEYAIDEDTARKDIEELLENLAAKGLIE